MPGCVVPIPPARPEARSVACSRVDDQPLLVVTGPFSVTVACPEWCTLLEPHPTCVAVIHANGVLELQEESNLETPVVITFYSPSTWKMLTFGLKGGNS